MIDELPRSPEEEYPGEHEDQSNTETVREPSGSEEAQAHEYAEEAKHYLTVGWEFVVRTLGWFWKWICKIDWMALATVAIAGSTMVYTHYARQQWTTMQAQLGEMQKSTKAAKDAADAATSAATIAGKALDFTKTTEQPYVSLESVTPSNFPDGKNPGFVLAFRNNGRSLAVNVVGNTTMTLAGTAIPLAKLTRLDPIANFTLPDIPVGSADTRWMAIPDDSLFQQHRNEVKSGTVRFIVRGFIRWEDRSGQKFPERTFCLMYDPNPARPPNIGILDFCEAQQQPKAK